MSQSEARPFTILLADDDEEDRELARDALQNSRLANEMKFVIDGQDLLDYLRHEGRWAGPDADAPRPGIILLDLNMPKMDGREALAEIKADESLRRIPIVVLTTSRTRPTSSAPTTSGSARSSPSRSRSAAWST